MMTDFSFEQIELEEITALDLKKEVTDNPDVAFIAYRITLEDNFDNATALVVNDGEKRNIRMGIAWGGNATWATVPSLLEGITMYFDEPEQWAALN